MEGPTNFDNIRDIQFHSTIFDNKVMDHRGNVDVLPSQLSLFKRHKLQHYTQRVALFISLQKIKDRDGLVDGKVDKASAVDENDATSAIFSTNLIEDEIPDLKTQQISQSGMVKDNNLADLKFSI